jgi:uncharacterized protein (DUF1810 family)
VPSAAPWAGGSLRHDVGVSGDAFDLERFVRAQDRGDSHQVALDELRAGRKLNHWIWWVFPQLTGLGHSETSRFYAISGLAEARAYLEHPVLGTRLRAATLVMAGHAALGARAVLGGDDIKFRSSMTLFGRADPDGEIFRNAIATFFAGEPDPLTEGLLDGS